MLELYIYIFVRYMDLAMDPVLESAVVDFAVGLRIQFSCYIATLSAESTTATHHAKTLLQSVALANSAQVRGFRASCF
jgi:hypothetical protein